MSNGTRMFGVRLPVELFHQVTETIDRRNENSKEEPWVLSDFIRIALAEKIQKMERSRGDTPEERLKPKVPRRGKGQASEPVEVENVDFGPASTVVGDVGPDRVEEVDQSGHG